MKRLKILPILLIFVLTLSSCEKYSSAYRATMITKGEYNDLCYLSFEKLEGTVAMKTKMTRDKSESKIHYKARLDQGVISVYYDAYDRKELLFCIRGGEVIEDRGGYVEKDLPIDIIVETDGLACGGQIEIDFK